MSRLGIVLIVENKSEFSLADQNIYLDDGGRGHGSQYVLPVSQYPVETYLHSP